jgi:hypothetical protein
MFIEAGAESRNAFQFLELQASSVTLCAQGAVSLG